MGGGKQGDLWKTGICGSWPPRGRENQLQGGGSEHRWTQSSCCARTACHHPGDCGWVGRVQLWKCMLADFVRRISRSNIVYFNEYFPALEHPKIRLPRELRTKYMKKVGEKINLTIPFQVRNKATLGFWRTVLMCYKTYKIIINTSGEFQGNTRWEAINISPQTSSVYCFV